MDCPERFRPQRLTTSLRERVWGRTRLEPWFPTLEPIGEAWYLSDRDLPLLVKMLFTSERLSVQVHPDDGEDGPRGKTEMWHIVDAEPGATIALGFREPITRERLLEVYYDRRDRAAAQLGSRAARARPISFPRTRYMRSARGIVLFEIQQNSDVTYRLWDYGRPREIHVEKAAPISDLGEHPGAARPVPLAPGHTELVRSKYFVTELIEAERFVAKPRSCQLIICIEGEGRVGGEETRAGEVWLLPDEPVTIEGSARFLRTFVPGAG